MHYFANPNNFMRYSTTVLPWLSAIALCCISIGLYLALFASPPDYQQGETVRIMYVHVPAAWLSLAVYSAMALFSIMFLVWKHPLADVLARASAPIGACFAFITLVTGALWGKPMWGAWWVWDARLTSMLILFFLYIGYIAFVGMGENERIKKSAAILALVGFVNIPVIKFSVDWWNTLHQPASIIRMDGPTIDPSMLWPLLFMIVGFMFLYATLLVIRAQTLLLKQKIQRLQARFN